MNVQPLQLSTSKSASAKVLNNPNRNLNLGLNGVITAEPEVISKESVPNRPYFLPVAAGRDEFVQAKVAKKNYFNGQALEYFILSPNRQDWIPNPLVLDRPNLAKNTHATPGIMLKLANYYLDRGDFAAAQQILVKRIYTIVRQLKLTEPVSEKKLKVGLFNLQNQPLEIFQTLAKYLGDQPGENEGLKKELFKLMLKLFYTLESSLSLIGEALLNLFKDSAPLYGPGKEYAICLLKGYLNLKFENFLVAEVEYKQALKLFEEQRQGRYKIANLYVELANVMLAKNCGGAKNSGAEAHGYLNLAEKIYQEIGLPTNHYYLINLKITKCYAKLLDSEYAAAEELANKALEIYKQIYGQKSHYKLTLIYRSLAVIAVVQSKYTVAIEAYKSALSSELFLNTGNKLTLIELFSSMGISYSVRQKDNDLDEALKCFRTVNEYLESGTKYPSHQCLIFTNYYWLALVNLNKKNYQLAIDYYIKQLQVAKNAPDEISIAQVAEVYYQIGVCYSDYLRNPKLAQAAFETCLKLKESLLLTVGADNLELSKVYLRLADVVVAQAGPGKEQTAAARQGAFYLKCFHSSCQNESNEDPNSIRKAHYVNARLFFQVGDKVNSIKYYRLARSLYSKLLPTQDNNEGLVANVNLALAEEYMALLDRNCEIN